MGKTGVDAVVSLQFGLQPQSPILTASAMTAGKAVVLAEMLWMNQVGMGNGLVSEMMEGST